MFNRRGQFLMHFPVNQLAIVPQSPSLSLSYILSLPPLAKRISFRSQTQSRPQATQKFAAPELTDLHVKLFFSILFTLAVNFSAISFGSPQISQNIIMRRSLWCTLYVRCTLWRRRQQQMETEKSDYDYVHSESAESATRATSWACPILIRHTIVHGLPLPHTMLRDFT